MKLIGSSSFLLPGIQICHERGRYGLRAQEVRNNPNGPADPWYSRCFSVDQVGGRSGDGQEEAGAVEEAP